MFDSVHETARVIHRKEHFSNWRSIGHLSSPELFLRQDLHRRSQILTKKIFSKFDFGFDFKM